MGCPGWGEWVWVSGVLLLLLTEVPHGARRRAEVQGYGSTSLEMARGCRRGTYRLVPPYLVSGQGKVL